MESRFRVLFLIGCVIVLSGCAGSRSQSSDEPLETSEPVGQVVDPEVERREVKEPAIDREDFEVTAYGGIMSVEDFGTDPVYGARLAYHLTEGFFVEGSVGTTEAGLTSFEELSGDVRFFEDRRLTYYNLNLGYNIFPGEAFLGSRRAYNTTFYFVAGLGSTSFAEDDRFTVNIGAGFRFLLSDAFALRLDFRDHMFDIDVVGREKTTHNLEAIIGLSFFF